MCCLLRGKRCVPRGGRTSTESVPTAGRRMPYSGGMTKRYRGYAQVCPLAKAAEVLCERWTLLVVRELMLGSCRFSELRRGIPGVSPTMLSQRLRELVDAGVV